MCEKVRRGVRRRTPRAIRHRDDSRGAVTVEAAAVIPVLVAIAIALAWLISLVLTQIRLVDAAREVARAAARAEPRRSEVIGRSGGTCRIRYRDRCRGSHRAGTGAR